MIRIPEYGELHVVSDLHLGGDTPGRQIFDQAEQFEQMIDLLLSVPDERKQALLINGDLVDFLAETNAVYFDPMGAADKLKRIFEDPSFARVWSALKKFVKKPNRTLIITLGNHDLELALPWVRVQLVQMLCDGNDEARARIILAFEEGGYRCAVGSADVLCVHGNEVDPWNVTDFEQLRRMGQNSLRGTEVEEWTPNGGTKLVIDVMNGLKRKHPFIDLLKPEEGGVIPTLLVLDPEAAAKIGGAVPAWLRSRWDQVKMAAGFLDEEEGVAIAEISKRQKKPVEFLGLFTTRYRHNEIARDKALEYARQLEALGEDSIDVYTTRRQIERYTDWFNVYKDQALDTLVTLANEVLKELPFNPVFS